LNQSRSYVKDRRIRSRHLFQPSTIGGTTPTLLSFGVLIEKNSAGEIAYRGNPADAEIILTLPPDIRDNDISTGTEVWLI
jgi:hypothetical protein